MARTEDKNALSLAEARKMQEGVLDGQSALDFFPAPEELTEKEARYWCEIMGSLVPRWVQRGDLPIFKVYVRLLAKFDDLQEEITDAPFITVSARGNEVQNPLFNTLFSMTNTISMLATRLRLSPSARYDRKAAEEQDQAEKLKRTEKQGDVPESQPVAEPKNPRAGLMFGGMPISNLKN